ncbi:MAG: hypothetical protein V1790_02975 [Planctomycetota bacterium]
MTSQNQMDHGQTDAEFLQQRLEAICRGLKEGIRREVARRRKLGLPIYVAENGTVVNRQTSNKPQAATPLGPG